MRVGDADLALFHAQDFPRGITELKDVALQTFDCEVFVDTADDKFAGFEHHGIVGSIRDCAARSDRRQASAASPANAFVNCVMMQISRTPAAFGGKTFR